MADLEDAQAWVNALRAKLGRLQTPMTDAAGKALYEAAREKVEAVAMERVPMKDGILRGTIETLPPVLEDDSVVVRVVCGGPAAPYAIAVHEHLSEHSPPSWKKAEENGDGVHFTVGGPKFLESALNDASSEILDETAKRFEIKNAWEEAD